VKQRIEELRSLFPIVKSKLYFDAASLSPLCKPVVLAQAKYAREREEQASLFLESWTEEIEECRRLVSGLLSSSADEIALTKNTTEGVYLTSLLTKWKKGDEVVVCDCDFPTNIFPFLNIRRKGVSVNYLSCKDGRPIIEDVERALTGNTRMLSISHVFYNSGFRIDLEEIGRLCRERGVSLHVDAAQSIGAFPINVKKAGIDYLSACGFKWLLSPLGTGVFYIKKEHLDKETPILGWLSVQDSEKLNTREYKVLESARRFEAGTMNIGGILGMRAALELIHSIGLKAVQKRILGLSLKLGERLKEEGFSMKSELKEKHRSGIICIDKRKITKEFLRERGLVATVRNNLRLSPHIYNNEDDIEKAVNILSRG
jgi:selenocysteine lyase/cysteine desulfurase